MNRKLSLVIILFFSVFVVGCATDGNQGRMGSVSDTFYGGERAIVMQFMDGAPPERVRDGGNQQFQVRISLENRGEHPIEEGEAFIALLGLSPADFNLESNSVSVPSLRGVRKQGSSVIEGGRQQVLFSGLSYLPVSVGSMPQSIVAEICYPYQTRAVIRACINENTIIGLDDGSRICDLEGSREFANSGGPIRIENVQQFAAGTSRIQINFDIVHRPTPDQGRVFRSGTIDSACRINGLTPAQASTYRNQIKFSVDSGLPGLNCIGGSESVSPTEGFVQLSNNRATVSCTQDTSGEGEYERPISVTLSYDYLERISTTITIEHISN